MKKAVTISVLSSLLIFLFGYTAFSKFPELQLFEATLSRMPLVRTGAAVLAPAVPLAELVIVLLLHFALPRLKVVFVLGVEKSPCDCG